MADRLNQPVSITKRDLDAPIELANGVTAPYLTPDFINLREDGFTIHYKQGYAKSMTHTDATREAIATLLDENISEVKAEQVTLEAARLERLSVDP